MFPSKRRSSGGEHKSKGTMFYNIASHAKGSDDFTNVKRGSFHCLFCRKGRHAKRSRAEHDGAEGTRGWALSLEEAFFMHHALQALTVSDSGGVLQTQVILLPACFVMKCTWHNMPLVSAACILRKGHGL